MALRLTLIFIMSFFTQLNSHAQTVIKMRRQGGVSVISCKVNGLKLDFIFDTGASDVSISLTEVLFMLKNGYLSEEDILGKNKYYNADGDLNEGLDVNLKEIEIAGIKLLNTKASIVKNLKAPLLLGQSAISKLGKIQLDLASNTITILSGKGQFSELNDSIPIKKNVPK
jgi:aspartyl protease family protein